MLYQDQQKLNQGSGKRLSKYKLIWSVDVVKVRIVINEMKTKEEIKILKMFTELVYSELN